MKIIIWSDFACPFCYIGETMLEKVLADSGNADETEIEFKAYELNPDAPAEPVETMTEHFMSGHEQTEEEARAQMERITRMAARAGLEYNLEGVKVCSTLDAHRLLKYAIANADRDVVLRLVFALFKANFTDNVLLSDRKVLGGIAEKCGLDREAVEKMFATEDYIAEIRADEKEADKNNLEYIPYMYFPDGEVLQGVVSVGMLKKALGAE